MAEKHISSSAAIECEREAGFERKNEHRNSPRSTLKFLRISRSCGGIAILVKWPIMQVRSREEIASVEDADCPDPSKMNEETWSPRYQIESSSIFEHSFEELLQHAVTVFTACRGLMIWS